MKCKVFIMLKLFKGNKNSLFLLRIFQESFSNGEKSNDLWSTFKSLSFKHMSIPLITRNNIHS